jgi:hypothetical protein
VSKFPDALIFASVIGYLQELRATDSETPAHFVSTDEDAFRTDLVLPQLRNLRCTYINSFENALSLLRNKMPESLS